jgi:4-amino-4-deoxy-L-arabinose transferase-like glycosyltransferase
MEAPLTLAYCGALYHFAAWRAPAGARRRAHLAAVALYFVLGFMTKFVAALFLPLIIVAAAALCPSWRGAIRRDLGAWMAACGLAVALIAPWFVWAHVTFGAALWQWMFGVHVYQRFAGTLHPEHLQPWWYYWTTMYARFAEAGSTLLVMAALPVLGAATVRRRWPEGLVVLLWFLVPMALITAGTSKLYHYVYPFLPALALAVGVLTAAIVAGGAGPFARALAAFYGWMDRRLPGVRAVLRLPAVRALLLALAAVSLALAAASLVLGTIRLDVDPYLRFRSRGIARPVGIAFLCALAAGIPGRAAPAVLSMLVVGLLPLPGYRASLERLGEVNRVQHEASACVDGVRAAFGLPAGFYVDLPDAIGAHALHYYFGGPEGWQAAAMDADDPKTVRPVLLSTDAWTRYKTSAGMRPAASVRLNPDVVLLLPGPYGRCATGGAAARR